MAVSIDLIKKKLGITHTLKDDAIASDIEAAGAELLRVGVSQSAVEAEDALVTKAIETYVMREYADPSLYDRYNESWLYQLDCLRKSGDYADV